MGKIWTLILLILIAPIVFSIIGIISIILFISIYHEEIAFYLKIIVFILMGLSILMGLDYKNKNEKKKKYDFTSWLNANILNPSHARAKPVSEVDDKDTQYYRYDDY